MPERLPAQGPIEVIENFANGAIRIEKEFDFETDREVEHVNILGVKIRRRNPEVDGLPGSNDTAENFRDLTFGEAEIKLLEAALKRYSIGHHTLFLSEPGFGKSTMMRFLAYLLNVPFHRVQCAQGMNVHQHFMWTPVRDNGQWKGRLGPLPQSMVDGGILLVDELPNLEPHERQIILEPTEHPNDPVVAHRAPELHIADFPGEEALVKAAPGWFLVATGNYQEGQAVGEIHAFTEREERRVRPYALPSLPISVRPGRLAGRYRKEALTSAGIDPNEAKTYHPSHTVKTISDEVIDVVATFFNAVDQVIRNEVLAQVRQDPQVYLNEAVDRAFDHFMHFQIKKTETSLENPAERIEEIADSAVEALEFYYVNSFREETKLKVPNTLLHKFTEYLEEKYSTELERNKYLDHHGRAQVREYLKWRIGALIEERFFKGQREIQGIKRKVVRHLRGQLQNVFGLPDDASETTSDQITHTQEAILSMLRDPSTVKPPTDDSEDEPPIFDAGTKHTDAEGDVTWTVNEDWDGFASIGLESQEAVMGNLEQQYAERLEDLAAFNIIPSVDDPTVRDAFDERDLRAPSWADIKTKFEADPSILERAKKLENPTLLVVPAGGSLKRQIENAKTKDLTTKLNVYTSWPDNDFDIDRKDELLQFKPDDPVSSKTKKQRLEEGSYGFDGWEVLIVDGGYEVPKFTRDQSGSAFYANCKRERLGMVGVEAYHALQMHGRRRGTEYDADLSCYSWLDAYLKKISALACGNCDPARRRLVLLSNAPETHNDNVGGRRSVRVI